MLASIFGVTARATSIPSDVTVTFGSLGFTSSTDYGSNILPQAGFNFTLSDQDWVEETGVWNGISQTGACLNSACINSEGIEQQTITIAATSGDTFSFVSFWDLNVCGPDQTLVVEVQGYLNNVVVATQTTGFINDTTCGGTAGTVTLNSGFNNVDKVVITSGINGFSDDFDEFVFDTAATVPGAPTGASATAGNTQATVTFSAPASNGGAAITGYMVISSPAGGTDSNAGSTSLSHIVTGLTNGQAYTFTVTAANTVGTGSASGASNQVTPAGSQTITFSQPATQNFGTSPTLAATASSSLTVAFTSSTLGVCTITSGGVLTTVTVGTCTINANQTGSASYLAAPQVSRSFSIAAVVPGAPIIGSATAGTAQATVTFTSPASNGGSAITGYTAISSPAGGFDSNAGSTGLSHIVTGLTNGQAYTFSVTAANTVGTGSASGASNQVTPAGSQTITFSQPATQNFGTSPTLTATASSALTVAFTSSTPGVCTITSGGVLTTVTVGTCTINADQAGNASYLAAAQVSRSFSIAAVVPGAPIIGSATAGNAQATVTFTSPASNGGAVVTGYTAISNPAGGLDSDAGSTGLSHIVTGLTNGQAYTFSVTATNSAGAGSASAASNQVTPVSSQIITFTQPGSQNFGTSPTLTATASSVLTVAFTSSTPGVCTITSGGVLTTVTIGTCTINANQGGNASYLAAAQVSRSFSIAAVVPGAPIIGAASAGNTQATVMFAAPVSNGGAVITGYTAISNPAGGTDSNAGSTGLSHIVTGLTNGQAYTFSVTATNTVGTGSASGASNQVTPVSSQIITFTNPGSQNFGTSPTLTATASSALTVAFTSSTLGVCTITSGGMLTTVTLGTCTINADQGGNSSYLAAAQVSRSFLIVAVVPGAPVIGSATAGNTQATVTFAAPASNGGAAITGYIAISSPAGGTDSNAGSTSLSHIVTGLTNGQAYTFTVTATNTIGTGPASGASNQVTLAASQTITFANPGAQNFGTSPTLTATASSGLALVFTSSTTGVCAITSGGALTIVTVGTCTINVNQAGNASFLAAAQVSHSFSIAAVVPGAPNIGSATASNAQATVTFTAPASNGGSGITGYTVTSSPAGGVDSNAGSTSVSHIVTGLTNGQAYTFTVTATNTAGTGALSAASNQVTPAASQTITFANPGAQNFGTSPTLTATASSTLIPVFTSSATGVCTITSGGALTTVTVGTCTINANQAGNASFLAAKEVSRSFSIAAVVPGAPIIGSATAGNAQVTVTFSAPDFNGGVAITGYTVKSSPAGGVDSNAGSTSLSHIVTGLTNGQAYTFTVTATNTAGTGSPSAASNQLTLEASQTITFANPGTQNFGTSPTLTATASSSLAPVFTSSTSVVCSITSSGVLTTVTAGTCSINVNQAGNASFLAAPQVSQSFSIAAVVPGAPIIGSATAGNTQATVTFSPPVSNGGAAITGYTAASSPGGLTGTGASSPLVVSGLTNGTIYTFAVSATNSSGTGPTSAESNPVTPQVAPAQPGSISVVSGSGQTGVLGNTLAAPLVVLVKDTSGLPLGNLSVRFGVVSGSATLSATSAVTGPDGTAEITATPTKAGIITISATPDMLSSVAIFSETGLSTAAGGQLSVLPPTLTFVAVQGGANPLPASIAVSSTGLGTLQWTASATGNPSWLAIGGGSGGTPAVLSASVNTAGLAAGSYTSAITLTSGSQQSTVAVALTVQPSAPAEFALAPAALVVNTVAGSTTAISRSIGVTNAGTGTITWSVTASTGEANSWLSVTSSTSGTTPSTVTVQLDPSALTAGQYLGNIAFSGQGVALATVAVVLNVSSLPRLISSVPVLEFRGQAGASFGPQTLPVMSSTDTGVSFAAATTVAAGKDWLTLSGASATTPASISASVNASGLAAGYYVGYIEVQSSGAANTLLVPVVLDLGTATAEGSLSVSPGGVLLTGSSGSSAGGTLTQAIALTSDAGGFTWNASALAGGSGTWLSVSPASGSGNGSITLTANLAGLQPGTYAGQVAINSTGTSNPVSIVPVTLIVSSGALVTSTNVLQSVQPAGGFAASVGVPSALQVAMFSSAGSAVIGDSVQVAFSTGDAPVSLADAGGGTYAGVWTPLEAGPVSLLFTSSNAAAGVVTGVVSAATSEQPIVPENSFVGAASFASGMPLGIGSISTVFGQNLASQIATASSTPLPMSLGGAAISMNGIAAPLFYASASQINFFVPYELAGQSTATIAISSPGGVVEVAGVPIAPQSPGIFWLDAAEDAAAVHLNGQIVSVAAPASGGEILEIFATGLGPVSNAPADGTPPASGVLAINQISPVVTIGGVEADVLFAGLAPGFVGLAQMNVEVPAGLPSGPATVTIAVGSLVGNSAVLQLQ